MCAPVSISPAPGSVILKDKTLVVAQLLLQFVAGAILEVQTHWMARNLLCELKGGEKNSIGS